MIVDPVVVIPDILSKKESLMDKFKFENKNGKLPKIAIPIHETVVSKNACRRFNFLSFSALDKISKKPMKIVMKEEDKKVLFF